MKLRKRRKKISSVVEFARKYFQLNRALRTITKQNTMNPIQTSATFAWRFLLVNLNLLFTAGFIQVRNHMCVRLVARDLHQIPNCKGTRQPTTIRDHTNARSAPKITKQKRRWTSTWNIILSLNFSVRNAKKSFTLLAT